MKTSLDDLIDIESGLFDDMPVVCLRTNAEHQGKNLFAVLHAPKDVDELIEKLTELRDDAIRRADGR